jgi:hypothetical protein
MINKIYIGLFLFYVSSFSTKHAALRRKSKDWMELGVWTNEISAEAVYL